MVLIVFVVLAAVLVVIIGLVVIGRETARLAGTARPAVFEIEEAIAYISVRLEMPAAGRLTPGDVRWILRTDATRLENASEDRPGAGIEVLNEDAAVAELLAAARTAGLDYTDEDLRSVLQIRSAYLRDIHAVGSRAVLPPSSRSAAPPRR